MNELIVGVDGAPGGEAAVAHARRMLVGGAGRLALVHVIEWSPYTFQTPEENAERHRRREEEIRTARERVLDPMVARLRREGVEAEGLVRHGATADILEALARERGAIGIVVARARGGGIRDRVFGSVAASLAMHASVPLTVVPAPKEEARS